MSTISSADSSLSCPSSMLSVGVKVICVRSNPVGFDEINASAVFNNNIIIASFKVIKLDLLSLPVIDYLFL